MNVQQHQYVEVVSTQQPCREQLFVIFQMRGLQSVLFVAADIKLCSEIFKCQRIQTGAAQSKYVVPEVKPCIASTIKFFRASYSSVLQI